MWDVRPMAVDEGYPFTVSRLVSQTVNSDPRQTREGRLTAWAEHLTSYIFHLTSNRDVRSPVGPRPEDESPSGHSGTIL